MHWVKIRPKAVRRATRARSSGSSDSQRLDDRELLGAGDDHACSAVREKITQFLSGESGIERERDGPGIQSSQVGRQECEFFRRSRSPRGPWVQHHRFVQQASPATRRTVEISIRKSAIPRQTASRLARDAKTARSSSRKCPDGAARVSGDFSVMALASPGRPTDGNVRLGDSIVGRIANPSHSRIPGDRPMASCHGSVSL